MNTMTRRSFVSTTAAAGLATGMALASSQVLAQETASSGASNAAENAAEQQYPTTPAEPIANSDIAETITADVIVVGAGHSGLCCALSAIEAGGNVIVVSASTTPISRGGSNNAVNSKAMERLGVEPMDIQALSQKEFMANSGCIDDRKWATYFANSEESMNWLIDIMEDAGYETAIEGTAPYPKGSPYYAAPASHAWLDADNRVIGMTQALVVNTLADKIVDEGGRIDYATIARQLVRGGEANGTSGRVDAVICERADGTYAKYVGTKAIVLATGDFSADRPLMEEHCPQAVQYMDATIADADPNYDAGFVTGGLYKGDGQKMGLAVGAAWQKNPINTPMVVSAGTATARPYCAHWGLKLNANGERFMNEDTPGAFAAFATSSQPGGTAYAIWDDAYADDPTDWRPSNASFDAPDQTTDEIKATWTDSYDTLEEAIEALGLPQEQTLATIERYNDLCAGGTDLDFYKDPTKMQPIATPPFHTGIEQVMFLTVMGGLRTNVNMQVCDENDKPIPGLYNVGTMVGDMYSNIYTFLMEGWNYGSTCLTFGRLTGKYVMENE